MIVAKAGDYTTHTNNPPYIGISLDTKVFVDGIPVLRLTDLYTDGSVVDTASTKVFASGLPKARIADTLKLGSDTYQIIPNPNIAQNKVHAY